MLTSNSFIFFIVTIYLTLMQCCCFLKGNKVLYSLLTGRMVKKAEAGIFLFLNTYQLTIFGHHTRNRHVTFFSLSIYFFFVFFFSESSTSAWIGDRLWQPLSQQLSAKCPIDKLAGIKRKMQMLDPPCPYSRPSKMKQPEIRSNFFISTIDICIMSIIISLL